MAQALGQVWMKEGVGIKIPYLEVEQTLDMHLLQVSINQDLCLFNTCKFEPQCLCHKCESTRQEKGFLICCGWVDVINNSDSKVVFIALDLSRFDTQ